MNDQPANKRSLGSLRGARRQAVSGDSAQLVRGSHLLPDSSLPKLIEPATDGLKLTSWAAGQADFVKSELIANAGLLLRGFVIDSPADLQTFMQSLFGEVLDYTHRVTKRTQVDGNIYTSTDYPPSILLMPHNEVSYTRRWPQWIAFLCVQPSTEGGETPIVDSRQMYADIPADIRQKFIDRKLMYVRNSGHAIDLKWQEVYQTEDRAIVEEYCRKNGIQVEWKSNGELRTRQICQSVARHPTTKQMVWFNQAHLFHWSCYQPGVRDQVLADVADEDLPVNVYYGDGSPIEPEVLTTIREIYTQNSLVFPWQTNDVLLLDNMLVAHGRRPFSGPRKVVVGMAGPYDAEDFQKPN